MVSLHLPKYRGYAWKSIVLALGVSCQGHAQTVSGVQGQTVTFEVPVNLTHPKDVQAAVACEIRDPMKGLAAQAVSIALNTPPNTPGATINSRMTASLSLTLSARDVASADGWRCQLLRVDGLPAGTVSHTSMDKHIPMVTADRVLATTGGKF